MGDIEKQINAWRRKSNVSAHYFLARAFFKMAWYDRSPRAALLGVKQGAMWLLGME